MIEYQIIDANSQEELKQKIQHALNYEKWKLQGGVSVAVYMSDYQVRGSPRQSRETLYSQSLVRGGRDNES